MTKIRHFETSFFGSGGHTACDKKIGGGPEEVLPHLVEGPSFGRLQYVDCAQCLWALYEKSGTPEFVVDALIERLDPMNCPDP